MEEILTEAKDKDCCFPSPCPLELNKNYFLMVSVFFSSSAVGNIKLKWTESPVSHLIFLTSPLGVGHGENKTYLWPWWCWERGGSIPATQDLRLLPRIKERSLNRAGLNPQGRWYWMGWPSASFFQRRAPQDISLFREVLLKNMHFPPSPTFVHLSHLLISNKVDYLPLLCFSKSSRPL